jgi:hypothetical protein
MNCWLQSCACNPTVNWLLVIDDKEADLHIPSNVKVVYKTLPELKAQFQAYFPFPISLDRPYKLCDWKPVYGEVFKDYLNGYDYWGHADFTDVILGDLRRFLTDGLLGSADKIGHVGHMVLYRNTPEVNQRYKIPVQDGMTYERVLGNDTSRAFDENQAYGMPAIYRKLGLKEVNLSSMFRDNTPIFRSFIVERYRSLLTYFMRPLRPCVYEWNRGKLYDVTVKDGKIQRTEILYVHYMRRKMEYFDGEYDHYYIIPNKFIPADFELTPDFVRKASKRVLFYKPYFVLRYRNLVAKIKMAMRLVD